MFNGRLLGCRCCYPLYLCLPLNCANRLKSREDFHKQARLLCWRQRQAFPSSEIELHEVRNGSLFKQRPATPALLLTLNVNQNNESISYAVSKKSVNEVEKTGQGENQTEHKYQKKNNVVTNKSDKFGSIAQTEPFNKCALQWALRHILLRTLASKKLPRARCGRFCN